MPMPLNVWSILEQIYANQNPNSMSRKANALTLGNVYLQTKRTEQSASEQALTVLFHVYISRIEEYWTTLRS
jgi:hypothetical protein